LQYILKYHNKSNVKALLFFYITQTEAHKLFSRFSLLNYMLLRALAKWNVLLQKSKRIEN